MVSLAVPPALWNSEKVLGDRGLAYKEWGTKRPPCPGAPRGPAQCQTDIQFKLRNVIKTDYLCRSYRNEILSIPISPLFEQRLVMIYEEAQIIN